jgi:hypothetical protein
VASSTDANIPMVLGIPATLTAILAVAGVAG